MRRIILGLAALLLVAACDTPQEHVYAIQTGYNAALSVAGDYEALPRCDAGAEIVCSDPAVVEDLRAGDDLAAPALAKAQEVIRDPRASRDTMWAAVAAAQGALDLLRSYLPKENSQ